MKVTTEDEQLKERVQTLLEWQTIKFNDDFKVISK